MTDRLQNTNHAGIGQEGPIDGLKIPPRPSQSRAKIDESATATEKLQLPKLPTQQTAQEVIDQALLKYGEEIPFALQNKVQTLSAERNFITAAEDRIQASTLGEQAETILKELREKWPSEKPASEWKEPMVIALNISPKASGTAWTHFSEDKVPSHRITEINGKSIESVSADILPHEVAHAFLWLHLGTYPPRWADEGMSCMVESASSRARQKQRMTEILTSGRQFDTETLLITDSYPQGHTNLLDFYAQSQSLVRFFLANGQGAGSDEQAGARKFMSFIEDSTSCGTEKERWAEKVKQHYSFESLQELHEAWKAWAEIDTGLVSAEGLPRTDL